VPADDALDELRDPGDVREDEIVDSDASSQAGRDAVFDEEDAPLGHPARVTAIVVALVMLGVFAVFGWKLANRNDDADSGPSPLDGKLAPALSGPTVQGGTFDLASQRGNWVVVNFFATWCVPCRQEHPDLVRFSQSHEAAGDAAVLAVVYSDDAQAVREFRDREGGTWPMLVDLKGRIALDYGVAGVPESFLISPEGVVVAKLLGGVRAGDLDQLLYQAKTGR
jgi:cytochrome c biogenesis protein CcmG/thiol:disulfide interchange protein DsbE